MSDSLKRSLLCVAYLGCSLAGNGRSLFQAIGSVSNDALVKIKPLGGRVCRCPYHWSVAETACNTVVNASCHLCA